MSDPSTPPHASGVPRVSPGEKTPADAYRLVQSTPEFLDLFVDILDEDDTIRDKLKQGIDRLLTETWKVRKWNDLKFFSAADVETALVPGNGLPDEILAPVIIKKVGCVVDYAKIGVLATDLHLDDIMSHLTEVNRKLPSSRVAFSVGSPPRKNSSNDLYDKKNLPKLTKFSGLDEDFFEWKDSTITSMGIYGFDIFLKDENEVRKYPQMGQSVFYLLRHAVHGGQAQSIAQAMVDSDTLDPVVLWQPLRIITILL